MPNVHEKISIVIIIIAILSLPLFSLPAVALAKEGDTFFEETGRNVDEMIDSFGSTLDDAVGSVRQVARLASTASRGWARKMLGATKQTALALVSSLSNPTSPPFSKGRSDIASPLGSDIDSPLGKGGIRGISKPAVATQPSSKERERVPPTLIERVIERVTTVKEVLPPTITSSDSRVNKLITDVADLTSRVDEKDGSGNNGLSLTSLHNMISQSQRIKTLDDVKITNATIEGYVTGTTLSTYLPLGGGTLTGGLTGTSLSLSATLSVTSAINASSTAHITGRL